MKLGVTSNSSDPMGTAQETPNMKQPNAVSA
jgi:hypothetical protein